MLSRAGQQPRLALRMAVQVNRVRGSIHDDRVSHLSLVDLII